MTTRKIVDATPKTKKSSSNDITSFIEKFTGDSDLLGNLGNILENPSGLLKIAKNLGFNFSDLDLGDILQGLSGHHATKGFDLGDVMSLLTGGKNEEDEKTSSKKEEHHGLLEEVEDLLGNKQIQDIAGNIFGGLTKK